MNAIRLIPKEIDKNKNVWSSIFTPKCIYGIHAERFQSFDFTALRDAQRLQFI